MMLLRMVPTTSAMSLLLISCSKPDPTISQGTLSRARRRLIANPAVPSRHKTKRRLLR